MKVIISLSAARTNEKRLVAEFKKLGCKPAWGVLDTGDISYKCRNWDVKTLKAVMEKCDWESQGKKLFPDNEGNYFIQKKGGEELAVIRPDADGLFYIEFSGY